MTGIPMNHIPYRGAADALIDVLGGRVPLGYFSIPSSLTHVNAGKLVALGVSDTARSPLLPEVPTISEAGLPGYEMQTWFAVWAPAGTPARVIEKLYSRNPDRPRERAKPAEAADRKRLPARRIAARGVRQVRQGRNREVREDHQDHRPGEELKNWLDHRLHETEYPTVVIPGRRVSAGPGIHNHSLGFRFSAARAIGAPRNDADRIRIWNFSWDFCR